MYELYFFLRSSLTLSKQSYILHDTIRHYAESQNRFPRMQTHSGLLSLSNEMFAHILSFLDRNCDCDNKGKNDTATFILALRHSKGALRARAEAYRYFNPRHRWKDAACKSHCTRIVRSY